METHKPLLKDADGEYIDKHMYRSMIGSLMYLTSSRPDIMFAVCQPKLGLWYPKDSPFDLVAYTNSDYARASLDRKSTTRGCQFQGYRWISWQCKKQTMVANFITEAEYVAASSCCGQIVDFLNASSIKYALIVIRTIYASCIEQFWSTAKAKTVNGEVQLQALVDGKKIVVTEASLTLMGAKTTAWNEFSSTMASAVILFLDKQVKGMSKHKEIYVTPSHTKKVFANMKRQGKYFFGRDTPLFPTMIVQAQEQPSRKQRKDIKDPQLSGPTEPVTDDTENMVSIPTHSNDLLLSGEDRLKLNELLELCTSLSQRVLDLEKKRPLKLQRLLN
ncbi:hypothetical protein Tco_0421498 [Tanacetum coccineum]